MNPYLRQLPRRQSQRAPFSIKKAGAGASFAFLLLVVGGCIIPPPENSGGELYHHNWWNYYVRGAYFLKENRVKEATADFQSCLGLIPGAKFGYKRDVWRARTYGVHFLEGYFPNRELGVCLYERQDYTQAIHYLEVSLQQEPSGRAKHYLNLARQKLLAGRGGVPGPQIKVEGESGFAFTSERSLQLRGIAAGEGRIRQLTVGQQDEFIELAAPTLSFNRKVSLAAGSNVVEVVAIDLLGQRTVQHVVRIADWQSPRFLVRRVVAQGREWLVEGVCRDEYGVSDVTAGGASIFRRAGNRGLSDVPISLRVPAEGVTLVAVDLAGNRLQCPLNAASLAQTAMRGDATAQAFAGPVWCALEGDVAVAANATVLDRMEAWSRACRSSANKAPVRFLAQTAPAAADRLRPALSLRGCQPLTRVFVEDFFVDGSAADGGGLASVTVNGENLLSAEDAGAVRTYFARRLPLDLGTNQFEIVATDRSGNHSRQELTVIRIRPEFLDERYRLSVGVPPLAPAEAGMIGIRAKRSMEAELTREPVRFRLLERNEGWEFVLQEQGLSMSDLADPSAALRIGKMVPAEMLLMGKVLSEAKGVTVYMKVVETGNGEVVFASDVYSADPDNNLDEVVAGLILKIEQGFPLMTGEVLQRQGSRVTLNVGRADGAAEKSRFLVLQTPEAEAESASQVCKVGEQFVQLQLERVQQNTSTARIIPSGTDAIVKEGYHVYTR
jgi:hypothetical protein